MQYLVPFRCMFALLLLAAACSSPKEQELPCVPDCKGKDCGGDGCGGSCGECLDMVSCTQDNCLAGKCQFVVDPFFCFVNKSCVPSGTINPENPCRSCQPSEEPEGFAPLEDGTACGATALCKAGECCDYGKNCEGKECGSDGCGGQCGACPDKYECKKGVCKEIPCTPDCEGKDCGQDGCGGSCGECQQGWDCEAGTCKCVPKCAGKECGEDGCGGECGKCTGINVVCHIDQCECAGDACADGCCGPGQVCAGDFCCIPACGGKECGDDGCGSVCGECQGANVECVDGKCVCPGAVCPSGCCQAGDVCEATTGECCVPQCAGKECGPDECGHECGQCGAEQYCIEGNCPPEGVECEDLNDVAWDGCTEGEIGEFVVNSHSGNWQVNAAVAPYPDGRFAVVWESKLQDGSKLGVYGQQLAASGKAFGFEFQANTFTPDDQGAPSAAALSSGNLVVVWESWGQDGPGYGIYGQLFNPDGSKAGKELLLNEYTKQDQRYPAVAATADGFVLAWSGIGEEDAGGVYVRRFDKDGAALGSQSLVNVTTDWDQRNPSLAGLADGTVAVVWESQNQDGSDGIGVFSRLFAADLTPAGSEFQVNVFSPGHQLAPRVSAFPAGGFVVVWQSEEQDGNGQGVFGRVYDASGLAVGTEFLLSANTLMDQEAPSVAALSDGDFVAAWQSKGDDGSDYTVMAARFKGNGDKEGKDWQVNVFADSNQSFPAVAALSSLGFVIVWQSWAQDGDGFAIVAQRYDLSGNKLYH